MRILVLTERYMPEITAPSVRVHEHAQVWLQLGHQVTVVTCVPNFPHGKVFPGYRNALCQEEWLDGVRVIRVWSYMAANEGVFRRTLDYASYMVSVLAFGWRYPSFDVVLATSPPLFTALAGYGLSRIRRRPWVFEIRDLWPASIKAVGASDSGFLRQLEKLELFLYRRANGIVALTESFRNDLVARGISPEKISVVTNGVDPEKLGPHRAGLGVRTQLGVAPQCFLAGYIGTTGMAHGLETVIEAARLCREDKGIHFLIMGEGATRRQLEQRARQYRLSNVTFADFVAHKDIAAYYAALDVGLVHLKPAPLFRTVIPSKIFEYMAMEVPLVMAAEGEGAAIVSAARCGICVPPGSAEAMAAAVRRLRDDQQTRRSMGRRGREAVEKRFNRTEKAVALLHALEHAIVRHHERKCDGERFPVRPPRGRDRWQRVHRDAIGGESARRAA